ncbi:MAG: hypothetical protein RSB25_15930 [Acinetobacter sp.]
MRVVVKQAAPYKDLTPQERLNSCYWHACICFAQGEYASNQSLREIWFKANKRFSGVTID